MYDTRSNVDTIDYLINHDRNQLVPIVRDEIVDCTKENGQIPL